MTTRFLRPSAATILRVAIGMTLLVSSACGGSDSPTEPTVNVPYSQNDLVVGTGAELTTGKTGTMSYSGWIYDASRPDNKGTLFDSGTLNYTHGVDQFIQGWVQGVAGMRVGGQRRLVIPPSLGYGNRVVGQIPANSTLVFDVALLNIL